MKETFKTTNSRNYKLLKRKSERRGCLLCGPHSGCNYSAKEIIRSWKRFRKTKWK